MILSCLKRRKKHARANHCYLCKQHFSVENKKVRDHCHITGQYRGPACNKCNLRYNSQHFKIPVIFHNLKNYDGNILLKYFNDKVGKEDDEIECIAENKEKIKTFTYQNAKFIDSLAFLNDKLESLVENLLKDKTHKWDILKNEFPNIPLSKLTSKGVYPYEYVTKLHVF